MELRAEYWIVKSKGFIKRLIRSCVICKRLHGRPYSYHATPELPAERLVDGLPFMAIIVARY